MLLPKKKLSPLLNRVAVNKINFNLGGVAMFKQTLLAVAIGTLVGVASPQAMAETMMTPAEQQQSLDIINAGRLQAFEKEVQTAKEAGDEKRATLFETAVQHARENPMTPSTLAETPAQADSKIAPAQATADTPLTPAEAAMAADVSSVGMRGAADAMQEKANEPGAPAFLKEGAATLNQQAETFAKDAATANTAAQEAAAKETAEAAAKAEPAAEPVAEATPEPAAEPVAETASEPAAEAAPEPAAESSGGE
jgi:hypothetical protein